MRNRVRPSGPAIEHHARAGRARRADALDREQRVIERAEPGPRDDDDGQGEVARPFAHLVAGRERHAPAAPTPSTARCE